MTETEFAELIRAALAPSVATLVAAIEKRGAVKDRLVASLDRAIAATDELTQQTRRTTEATQCALDALEEIKCPQSLN